VLVSLFLPLGRHESLGEGLADCFVLCKQQLSQNLDENIYKASKQEIDKQVLLRLGI
jgi:hypothetical protein